MDKQAVVVFSAIVLIGLWPALQIGGWLADRVPRPSPAVSPTPSGSGVLHPAPARTVVTWQPYNPPPRSTWRPPRPDVSMSSALSHPPSVRASRSSPAPSSSAPSPDLSPSPAVTDAPATGEPTPVP